MLLAFTLEKARKYPTFQKRIEVIFQNYSVSESRAFFLSLQREERGEGAKHSEGSGETQLRD